MIVNEVERWKAADVKELAAYLGNPTPETILALVGEDVKPDGALGKLVKKAGDVLAYDVQKRKLPEWVSEQFQRLNATADAEACRALVELVGDNLDELATEIEKLATWAGGEPIDVGAVELLAAGRAETAIFALSDAWGRGDVAAVLSAVESRLERSDRPRSSELARLVGMLVNHVDRVRACQVLAARGIRARDAAAQLKLHPFVTEKAFQQARNYSRDELATITVRLAQLDHALKGGSRLPSDLELERTLIEITSGRAA